MIFIILSITLLVQIYCLDYMWNDPFFTKFYAYLSLFAFFMLFLVSSNNYLQIFLGWEGVGLVSFMLISFWNTRKDAIFAGMKAMFINRIGDIFFIFGIIMLFSKCGTLNFNEIFTLNYNTLNSKEIYFFGFFIVFAAMAKSAQLGLHTWLPDAMEGPTPVSALIHAATMVTAGIFVIIRSSFILIYNGYLMDFMAIVGGVTIFFGASVACFQMDIKKIIAYSTISQIGYMMLACGSGNFVGAIFHLFTHAFFKALLFLSSGSVIHAMNNEQDIRKMGGLFNFLPFTYVSFLIGSLSLLGFPFFSGFYSKDNILEFAFLNDRVSTYIGYFFGLISIFFTSFYSFRLLYWVFLAPYSGQRKIITNIYEAPFYMMFSMSILIFPSIFFGFIFYDYFVGMHSVYFWFDSVYNFSNFVIKIENYKINKFIQNLPFIFIFLGFKFFIININKKKFYIKNKKFKIFYNLFSKKWYFDDFYNYYIKNFMFYIYKFYWITFEKGFLIYFGPKFFINIIKNLAIYLFNYIENNNISKYFKYIYACIFFSISLIGIFSYKFFFGFNIDSNINTLFISFVCIFGIVIIYIIFFYKKK